jgi:hypothetical protein
MPEMYASTGNRVGKTELAGIILSLVGAILLRPSIANPAEWPVLNASITQDQANLAWGFCERLCYQPRFQHWVDDIVMSPFPTIRFAHGGELTARSTQYDCKYIEGHKFRWINFDEIALGSQESLDVLRMRVADVGGTVVGTGTPRGKNWYYRNCWRPARKEIELAKAESRPARAYTMTATSYDNPHISHKYLRDMESKMSSQQVAQKIYGEFTDDEAKVFSADAIDGVTNPDLNIDYEAIRKLVKGQPISEIERKRAAFLLAGGYWVNAWDLAKQQDWTVCTVLRVDVQPWQLLYFDRYQRVPWPQVEADIKHVADVTGSQAVIYDATGMDTTGDHLDIEEWRVEKFVFTAARKSDMIANLQRCIEHKLLQIPYIPDLDEELHDYEHNDKALVQDCVMSLGMACWAATEAQTAIGPQPAAVAVGSVRSDL